MPYPFAMNDQNKTSAEKPSKIKCINGAWIDVKLCTLTKAKKKQSLLAQKRADELKAASQVNEAYVSVYNELHYGNYE